MTTTNNNREYAIRLYYEVREADNSINCKTAYKVFDNLQDAANYAIDFIANNPDANFRLTNEHFNGSQISVYGDSPTKHYNLTDADINAVRNVEGNEADVEDYAVTEAAQDIATLAEMLNAANDQIAADEPEDEPPVPPTVETGNYYSAHIYFYRANPPKGYSNDALTVEEFDSAKDAADFIIKFAAEHTITAATIFTADAEYRLTEADFNALYPIDEPPTPPSDDNISDDEPILCEQFFTKTYHVLGALRITHFNSLEEAIRSAEAEIVDNDRLSHVQVARMSKGGNIEIVADFEQGYKPQPPTTPTVEESADEEDFAREYAQAAEASARIRQIDPDAEILFAEDEEPAERFILTTGDNSCANCATAAEAEDLFYALQEDKQYTPVDTEHHTETIRYRDGKWVHVDSAKYGADIYRKGLGGVDFVIRDDAGEKSFVTEDEFFAEMVKRGACSIDTPEPPADGFAAQLARLRNAQDAAKRQRDFAQDAFNKAQSAWVNAQHDIDQFINTTTKNLCDQLLGEDIFSAYITVTAHDGKRYPNKGLGHIWINFLPKEGKFGITCDWENFAAYDTPAQVTAAIELLRDAINQGATEFKFPTVDEFDTVRNISAAVSKLNAAAPEGWEVVYSFARKNFAVKFKDETVCTLDSLVLAKILPPDKFFAQFNAEHFADDLDREIADLQDMRAELADDPERSKILDELIADGKREKFIAQLTLPPGPQNPSTPSADF